MTVNRAMATKRRGKQIDGWLALDKPAGMTSARAVARVLRLTDARKSGHGGTLDPLATGILPIALGEATKTAGYLMACDKRYEFEVRWGEERDTDDIEGEVVATSTERPDDDAILAALPDFCGWISQVPPTYSAIKVKGRRAYDLARQGQPAALEPRQVQVKRFELVGRPDAERAAFTLECGKGTYVRALARDLGRRLGTRAHVTALRRTRVGPFDEEGAFSLDKLAEVVHSSPPSEYLYPVETALADIPALILTESQAIRMKSGQALTGVNAENGTVCAMCAGRAVAVAEVEGGEVRPVRVFNL
jgi:tRNA pseudouridine55 synthase